MPSHFPRAVTGRLLEGRTAVISGAGRARGIGKATARLFLQHGAAVALLDLDEDEVAQAALELAEDGGQTIGGFDTGPFQHAPVEGVTWKGAAAKSRR